MISFIWSITNTSAAITLLCLAAMPFITALLSFLFLKEKISLSVWLTIILAALGIVILAVGNKNTGSIFTQGIINTGSLIQTGGIYLGNINYNKGVDRLLDLSEFLIKNNLDYFTIDIYGIPRENNTKYNDAHLVSAIDVRSLQFLKESFIASILETNLNGAFRVAKMATKKARPIRPIL